MNPLIQLWLASGVGAALFFSVGFLLSRAMQRAEQGLADDYLARLRAELEHAQFALAEQGREVDHLAQRAQRAEQSASDLSAALARARAECVRLDKDLAGRALGAERSSSQELERLRQELRESGRRVQLLSTRAARLDAQEKDNSQLKKQCEAMSNELHRLRQSTPAHSISSVSEHAISSVSERPPLSGHQLSGHQLVVPPAPRIANVGHSPESSAPVGQGLEAILQRQLSLLMVREPGVTAVLSDAHGLALVGLGPAREQEHVSVLTSIARDLAARARELVGFEQVESLEILEGAGRALRVRFFDWADQPLALGYLGARRWLQSEAEERMVSSFPPLRIVRSA